MRGYTNCDYAGVTGLVKHADGSPLPGVAVGVWSDTWEGKVSVSEASGKYDVGLAGIPPGMFKAAVVKLDSCSQQDGRVTAKDCKFLSNLVSGIVITEQCQGEGANQVTEVDFVGP
jgi:hypothetical protein